MKLITANLYELDEIAHELLDPTAAAAVCEWFDNVAFDLNGRIPADAATVAGYMLDDDREWVSADDIAAVVTKYAA